VVQLVKRRADVEKEIDAKLKALRDDDEKERQRLEADVEATKHKLNNDYQQHVSLLCFLFVTYVLALYFCSLVFLCYAELWSSRAFKHLHLCTEWHIKTWNVCGLHGSRIGQL